MSVPTKEELDNALIGEDTFFSEQEKGLLNRSVDIRFKMIDKMMEDGIPYKTNEVRVINELLNSVDQKTMETAKLRLKHQENTDAQSQAEIAAEILKNIANSKSNLIERTESIPVIDTAICEEVVIVPGELDIKIPTLTFSDLEEKE